MNTDGADGGTDSISARAKASSARSRRFGVIADRGNAHQDGVGDDALEILLGDGELLLPPARRNSIADARPINNMFGAPVRGRVHAVRGNELEPSWIGCGRSGEIWKPPAV